MSYEKWVRCRGSVHDPEECSETTYAVAGLAAEVGELAGVLEKSLRGPAVDRADFLSEAGDILYYLTRALASQGLSLADAMTTNRAKLERRDQRGKDKPAERELIEGFLR